MLYRLVRVKVFTRTGEDPHQDCAAAILSEDCLAVRFLAAATRRLSNAAQVVREWCMAHPQIVCESRCPFRGHGIAATRTQLRAASGDLQ